MLTLPAGFGTNMNCSLGLARDPFRTGPGAGPEFEISSKPLFEPLDPRVRQPETGVLRPSLEQFEALARRGNLIPVAREILADLDTPLSLFRRLDDGATSFLFESVQGGEKWARYKR